LIGDFEDSGFDRLKDLQITRAAAEISRERFSNLIARGVWILIEQRFCRNENCRSAVAALRRPKISERLLQRMQPAIRAEAFYRFNFSFIAFDSQEQAREDGFSVEKDGAGAAFAEFTAMFSAGMVEIFAEDFEQGLVRRKGHISLFAVQR